MIYIFWKDVNGTYLDPVKTEVEAEVKCAEIVSDNRGMYNQLIAVVSGRQLDVSIQKIPVTVTLDG